MPDHKFTENSVILTKVLTLCQLALSVLESNR